MTQPARQIRRYVGQRISKAVVRKRDNTEELWADPSSL